MTRITYRTSQHFPAGPRGFTLVEVLITVAVLAILSSPLLVVFRQAQNSFTTQSGHAQLSQQMRLAMNQICSTIRQAGNDPEGSISNPVELLGSGHIRLRSDITGSIVAASGNALDATGDPDGLTSALFEVVSYRHDSAAKRIMADIGSGEEVLAENVIELSFETFDLDGVATTTPGSIARVRVTMVGETALQDLELDQRLALTLQSGVMMRSRTPPVVP